MGAADGEGGGGNEKRNGKSEGWRYDGITEREREAKEGKETGKRGVEAGEIAVD